MYEVHLDYETYSEADLPVVGGWSYAQHKSTEVLIVCYRIGKGEIQRWRIGQPPPADLIKCFSDTNALFRAFNADFEMAITELVLTRQWGLKPNQVPDSRQWRCTQALAIYCGLPHSLAKASAAIEVEGAEKDKEGQRLIAKFSIPKVDKATGKFIRILPTAEPEEFEKYIDYCEQDVYAEEQVRKYLPVKELEGDLNQSFWANSQINKRGAYLDHKLIRGAIKISVHWKSVADAEMRRVTGWKKSVKGIHTGVEKTSQLARIKTWIKKQGVSLPASLDAEGMDLVLSREDLPDRVRRVLELRASCSQTSTAKYAAAVRSCGKDGRMRGAHQFYGAHTGRIGGRFVQFQNLPRPRLNTTPYLHYIRGGSVKTVQLFFDNPMQALRDSLRAMIIAPEGKHLLISDWNAIEARILHWLAEDHDMLKAFREGRDPYKELASIIFGVPVSEITKDQRALGKEAILGLGYGMWEKTFITTCRTKGVKESIASDELICKTARLYRNKYKKIVNLWSMYEKGLIKAWHLKQDVHMPCGVVFGHNGKHGWIRLPSGRRIWYHKAGVTTKLNKFSKRSEPSPYYMADVTPKAKKTTWVRRHLHGGIIVENVDQGIAADLMLNTLVEIEEDISMDAIIHVHDEVVCEANQDVAHEKLQAIMGRVPTWAPGLPLKAESKSSLHYVKG